MDGEEYNGIIAMMEECHQERRDLSQLYFIALRRASDAFSQAGVMRVRARREIENLKEFIGVFARKLPLGVMQKACRDIGKILSEGDLVEHGLLDILKRAHDGTLEMEPEPAPPADEDEEDELYEEDFEDNRVDDEDWDVTERGK